MYENTNKILSCFVYLVRNVPLNQSLSKCAHLRSCANENIILLQKLLTNNEAF